MPGHNGSVAMKNSSDLDDRALDNLRRTLYARLEAAKSRVEQSLYEGTIHHLERLRRERDEAHEALRKIRALNTDRERFVRLGPRGLRWTTEQIVDDALGTDK